MQETSTRSRRHIPIRNRKLVIRYYYWREIRRRRMDDVFEILSDDEFFLDQITIRRIIRAHLHLYDKIKADRPSEKQLENYTFI